MRILRYETKSGIAVSRTTSKAPFRRGLAPLLRKLDRVRGFYLSSGYEYPGRYSRWDIAAIEPPLEIISWGPRVVFRPLNPRGRVLCQIIGATLENHPHWESFAVDSDGITARLKPLPALFSEEERSKQPSVFSMLRALIEEFRHPDDSKLSLVGAFGYDLLFQFDPIELKLPRDDRKDLHLYFCDDIYYMDRKKEVIERYQYDFALGGLSTAGLDRASTPIPRPRSRKASRITSNHTPAEYMANVEKVRAGMKRGDFYEVVLRQTFQTTYSKSPSKLFETIQKASPSPYEFILQLGEEQLIGASPEMFVRVEGPRVETCPISGTARRTGDPMVDAENIKQLLMSPKEESELTMCTDVDRNDKSRICRPGTVKLLGRRQIETYAGLFHTVDHVEGRLRDGLTGLDAFLSHMWAVTLTGAPKKKAVEIVEESEKGPRGWYGGAVGALMLSGDVSTGITIRTVHLKDGEARYRVGATLVWDSVGAEEDAECRTKATNLFRALAAMNAKAAPAVVTAAQPGTGRRVLLIDNEDSFVHTLADYFRQTGATVETYRHGLPFERLLAAKPDLVVHSPGPGRPEEFGVPDLVRRLAASDIAQFGVCLGLQGMVEAFGGALDVLPSPRHGKTWDVLHDGDPLFAGVPSPARVGAYHSLTARLSSFPHGELLVTARTAEGLVMAIRHKRARALAVQFHPESILSMRAAESGEIGHRLIGNLIAGLASRTVAAAE